MKLYLGSEFIKASRRASATGRKIQADPKLLKATTPGATISNAGGLRILLLISCGPCVVNKEHFRRILKLVEK